MDEMGHDIPEQHHRDVRRSRHQELSAGSAADQTKRARRYLPTLSDLVDRLTIVLQKEIFIPEHRDAYRDEMALIMHDIDLILADRPPLAAEQIKAIVVIQLANAWIWQNESRIRDGSSTEPSDVQLKRLKGTHAVNGVRATGKNALAAFDGGRMDYKIDSFASELIEEHGNWNVFD
jgi:hypothetical protein